MILGRVLIFLVVIISSVTPVFSRELGSLGWSALQTSAIRGLVGAVVLGIFYKRKIIEARKDIVGVAASAVSILIAQTFYIYAAQHAGIGLVISLMYLGPVWTVLYERIFLKVRNKSDIVACAFGFIGTLLVAFSFNWKAGTELMGVLSALAASIGFAMFLITSKSATEKVSPESVAFWGCVFVATILGLTLFFVPWTVAGIKISLAFGLINGALYFLLYYNAIKLIPSSSETAVWCYLEVAIVWIIGILAYHEVMKPIALIGTLSIVSAGLILIRRAKT